MSKTISVKNITQSFFEKSILEGVSFKFTDDERICIVGDNGTGKSTLLKIITGSIEQTSGTIEKNGHIRTHYVPQEFGDENLELTIEEYINKYAGISLYKKVFASGFVLGFNLEKNISKGCRFLSGGQQKILALSVGLAVSPDFLLLDEPENHLDIVSRLELTKLLADYRGGVLFVSHDRLMIDAVATKVAEVVNKKVYISEGGYQDYIDNRLTRIAGMQRDFDKDSRRIKQLMAMMPILESKAFRGKEVSAYLKRKAELQELKEKQKEAPRASDKRSAIRLRHGGADFHGGKLLCRVEDARFRYKGNKGDIFKDINLELRTGKHIVLLGRNGSGKSTFLKCLTGNEPFTSGSVTWAEDLTTSYFDQHAEFDGTKSALEVVTERLRLIDEKGRAALGAMRFDSDKMDVPISTLSGGERMRIRFALVFGTSPDFIVLDEPTNHLDEVTWQILLDACNVSKSTILLVTHDYEFINEFKNKTFWLIKSQSIKERHKDLEEIIGELRSK
ncbi:MAG: ABC-F family ATP-binding cassette domain-containing protein [Candidatus Pacebacteria bacterium]|nr:ABC-F family ATP-binding cassette domain-containing protein [Candidatus Paceibacterota bacterium]